MVTAAFAVPPPISAQVHRIVDEEELINKESAQLASEAASMAKARQAAKRCVFQFSESLGRFFFFFFLCFFFFRSNSRTFRDFRSFSRTFDALTSNLIDTYPTPNVRGRGSDFKH
jgi:predicted PurR-regulated permease PerM